MTGKRHLRIDNLIPAKTNTVQVETHCTHCGLKSISEVDVTMDEWVLPIHLEQSGNTEKVVVRDEAGRVAKVVEYTGFDVR